jgi:hypothetical protein
MRRRLALSVMALAWCSARTVFADQPELFPLQKGNFWIYEGDVSWVEANPATGKNQIYRKHLTWRSEVTATEKKDNFLAALLHGFPTDLTWYDSHTVPSDRLLLLIGTDYYEITDHAVETFQKIVAAKGDWGKCYQDIDAAQSFLPGPLAGGKYFGGSPGNYISGRYCYIIDDPAPFDLASVKNAPKLAHPVGYSIGYHANPEEDEMEVVPGLGIVHYGYIHNGTTMNVDIHLVKFGRAP